MTTVVTVNGKDVTLFSSEEQIKAAKDRATRIRRKGDEVIKLMKQAYDEKDYLVLGYESWREYVVTEFGMSQSSAYRMLTQAKVIEAIGVPVNQGDAQVLAQSGQVDTVARAPEGSRRDLVQSVVAETAKPKGITTEDLADCLETLADASKELAVNVAEMVSHNDTLKAAAFIAAVGAAIAKATS